VLSMLEYWKSIPKAGLGMLYLKPNMMFAEKGGRMMMGL